MKIKISVDSEFVTAIAEDLQNNSKNGCLQPETVIFLQNVLRLVAKKAEQTVVEDEDILDAVQQAAILLNVSDIIAKQ
jgi:hypothetical protein